MYLVEQAFTPTQFGGLAGPVAPSALAVDQPAAATPDGARPVLVLGSRQDVPLPLAELCAAMDLELLQMESHHELPFTLHHRRPAAVVCVADQTGRDVCKALRSVASFDQDMPVLIITDDDPVSMGTIDAAERLWSLTGLHCVSKAVDYHDVVTFLFHAGRQSKTGRLLPVA
jgi:hypothetical protein